MFELKDDFDYKAVLQNYSLQAQALAQSSKLRPEDNRLYEESLNEHKKAFKEFVEREGLHQNIRFTLSEYISLKNAFHELQEVPNEQIGKQQKEIFELYENFSKDSDDFLSSINEAIAKFQNLGMEFEDQFILQQKSDISCSVQETNSNIRALQEKFGNLKIFPMNDQSFGLPSFLSNVEHLRQFALFEHKERVVRESRSKIDQNEANLEIVCRNIEFLKTANREAELQYIQFS